MDALDMSLTAILDRVYELKRAGNDDAAGILAGAAWCALDAVDRKRSLAVQLRDVRILPWQDILFSE